MTKIYEIRADRENYDGEDWDGVFHGDRYSIPSSTMEQSQQRSGKAPKTMPASFDFDTDNPDRLKNVNIVSQRTNVEVFSNILIHLIGSVGAVDWTLVPARFFDSSTGNEISTGDFSAVYFEYFSDCFDYELSEYQPSRYGKKVRAIKNLVLKEPEDGFPPFFKLLASPIPNYISEATYEAIIAGGIANLRTSLIGDF